MDNQALVTTASVAAGAVCFVMYVWATAVTILTKPALTRAHVDQQAAFLAAKAPSVSIDDVTKLMEALGKLTDSLAKAGPGLTSLMGAILFFAIAAFASGALHGSPDGVPAHATGGHVAEQTPGPSVSAALAG